jgi:hypothetical protein
VGQLDELDLDRQAPAPNPPVATVEAAPPPVVAPRPAAEPVAGVAPPPPAPAAGWPPKPALREPDTGVHEPEGTVSSRGIWIAGIGATVAVAAAILLPVSSSQIESDRANLAKYCATTPKDDTCTATAGHGPDAQSLADSIATWKVIQTGAKIGIGVGLVAVAGGLLLRWHDGAEPAPARPALVFDAQSGRLQLGLGWARSF